MEDVKDECEKYGNYFFNIVFKSLLKYFLIGKVLSLKIPRPVKGEVVHGVGKIFVEFS